MEVQAQYVQQQELYRSNHSPQQTQWVQQHQQVLTGAMRREGFGHEVLMTPKTTRQEVEERLEQQLQQIIQLVLYRCSLSYLPCELLYILQSCLNILPCLILPVPLVVPGFSL